MNRITQRVHKRTEAWGGGGQNGSEIMVAATLCFIKKGSLDAHSSLLHRVWGRVRPLWVLCTQSFVHLCKKLFPGLEPMTLWSNGNNFTAASGLPFDFMLHYLTKNILPSKHDMAEMLICVAWSWSCSQYWICSCDQYCW
jgi:hypothetical protein